MYFAYYGAKNKSTEEKLRSVRHIALDMDGTIYCGSTLFDCTLPFLATLRRLGIGYSFMTNNPTRSIADYVAKLRAMGVEATADQVYSTSVATIEFIKTNHPEWRRLFILGTASMTAEFVQPDSSLSDSPRPPRCTRGQLRHLAPLRTFLPARGGQKRDCPTWPPTLIHTAPPTAERFLSTAQPSTAPLRLPPRATRYRKLANPRRNTPFGGSSTRGSGQ